VPACALSPPPPERAGGEQQRGCLARAVASASKVVLLDEPTGSLDRASAEAVMEAFCSPI